MAIEITSTPVGDGGIDSDPRRRSPLGPAEKGRKSPEQIAIDLQEGLSLLSERVYKRRLQRDSEGLPLR